MTILAEGTCELVDRDTWKLDVDDDGDYLLVIKIHGEEMKGVYLSQDDRRQLATALWPGTTEEVAERAGDEHSTVTVMVTLDSGTVRMYEDVEEIEEVDGTLWLHGDDGAIAGIRLVNLLYWESS